MSDGLGRAVGELDLIGGMLDAAQTTDGSQRGLTLELPFNLTLEVTTPFLTTGRTLPCGMEVCCFSVSTAA